MMKQQVEKQQVDETASWQNNLESWQKQQVDEKANWQNDLKSWWNSKSMKWQVDKMNLNVDETAFDVMASWQITLKVDGTARWWNGKFTIQP